MFPLRIAALRFAPEGRVVLDELDLVLAGEGISVILGPNGSGKTVLLRLLAGLLPVHGGTIVWGDAAQPAGRLAMVFQQPMLLRMSVFANVEFALRPQALTPSRTPGADDRGAGTRRPGLSRTRLGPPAFRRRAPAPGAGPRLGDAPAPAAARRTDRQP